MQKTRRIPIADTGIGGEGGLLVIAGPCVIESEAHARKMAERLAAMALDMKIPFVFKSSFDKANRSSIKGFRGPGLKEGLRILAKIKEDLGLPVLSDVHEIDQIAPAAEVLDVIQIPAFLCRQTDFLVAAAKSGRPVNVKKGQFMAPWNMEEATRKITGAGNERVFITERGFTFGYNNLVADMRALPIMRRNGTPVVFDATHSVQLPGGRGDSSGGERNMAAVLARAAVAAGVDGLFLETHDNPDDAPCDGPNMIPLDDLPDLLRTLVAIDGVVRAP